jgi:hypothetical protein
MKYCHSWNRCLGDITSITTYRRAYEDVALVIKLSLISNEPLASRIHVGNPMAREAERVNSDSQTLMLHRIEAWGKRIVAPLPESGRKGEGRGGFQSEAC